MKIFLSVVGRFPTTEAHGYFDKVFLGDAETSSPPSYPCLPGSSKLCLTAGRFKVEATWKTADGKSGFAHTVQLQSDSGYLWFFNQSNIEVVVKVLNACGLNNRYWVFAGGLTNVEVTLTITDTKTAATRTYKNPQGKPFAPIQDTSAFATCP